MTIRDRIMELRKQAQQKMNQLDKAIVDNDNKQAVQLTLEISQLHTEISTLALQELKEKNPNNPYTYGRLQ